jgi:DNA polymerase I-like protein with 3'-5' exonuclease and polymerase domains
MQVKVGSQKPESFFQDEFYKVEEILKSASCVITFNGKFDLNWLQRELGIQVPCVWDCQLAEFILSNQTWRYPDLATTCEKHGVASKLDIVKTEYWSKGIDTCDIPKEILVEYGEQDVESTYQVFLKQVQLFSNEQQSKFKLFRMHCNDLLVLQEMEYNGIQYDSAKSLARSEELGKQLAHIEDKLAQMCDIPINWDSRDHVSVFLYGGTITEETRLPIGVFKTGAKIGQTRYKVVEREYSLPRLVQPVKGSELKKEGYFGTDEQTLLSLKPNATIKKVIKWLLERSKIKKLQSTYLEGLPNLIETMDWSKDMLYPNYNQCMAQTGRLSSTKPNAQNLPKEAKSFCTTRF